MSRKPKSVSNVVESTKPTNDYGCSLRQLPEELAVTAAEYAVKVNPNNGTPLGLASTLSLVSDGIITPGRIAVLVSKYWGKNGVNLTVSFLSNASAALKDKILLYMNKWNKHANVNFSLATGNNYGDVRITLAGGGYWSYLGTDIRQIPKNQPTMSLHGFSLSTPDSEYDRVVTHEVGHTLGFPHEHMRAEIINRLDYEKTIAYFRATQGWSRQDVIAQVLTPLEESQIIGTEHAEEDSIMTYSLPASITRDGKPIKGGSKITPSDGLFSNKLYPKPSAPVDPEDPTTPIALPEPVILLVEGAKRWDLQNPNPGSNTDGNIEIMKVYGAKKFTVQGFRMVKADADTDIPMSMTKEDKEDEE